MSFFCLSSKPTRNWLPSDPVSALNAAYWYPRPPLADRITCASSFFLLVSRAYRSAMPSLVRCLASMPRNASDISAPDTPRSSRAAAISSSDIEECSARFLNATSSRRVLVLSEVRPSSNALKTEESLSDRDLGTGLPGSLDNSSVSFTILGSVFISPA